MQPGEGDALKKVNLADSAGINYDLIIKGGDKNILETPEGIQPVQGGGPRKYGDFDPHFGNIEVTTWEGGWGGENLSDDSNRYQFAKNMWTATRNKMFPAPLASHYVGMSQYTVSNITQGFSRPTSPLIISGQQTGWYANSFTVPVATSAKYAYVWVRYDGTRTATATITAEIYSDSGGNPNASLGASAQVTLTGVQKGVWALVKFTWSTAVTLSTSTTYWIVFKMDAGTDEDMADFLLAIGNSSAAGKRSANSGSSWSLGNSISYFIRPAKSKVKYAKLFELDRTVFKLLQYKTGVNELWMAGDHGKATSATASTLVDTGMGVRTSWTTNQWAGEILMIVAGTGVGQERTISSNTNAGSITVSEDWDITPDTTSEYAIIAFDDWYEVPSGTHGLSYSKNAIEINRIVYFSKGFGVNMKRMRFNGSALQFADDGTNDADLLFSDGMRIWKGTDDDGVISYAAKVAWGTDLTFTALANTTPIGFNFTGAGIHGGNLYFFKEDTIWFMSANDTVLYPYPTNMSYFINANNGRYVATDDEYLVFSWGASIERLAGLSVEHVDPNRDRGMDGTYKGVVGGLAPHPAGVFFAINGGDSNVSSVNVHDGLGFHSNWTSEIDGVPVLDIRWYNKELGQPTLLIAFGENIVYQQFPKDHTNPLNDSSLSYCTQGELTTTIIDMGNKSIPKFFKELVLFMIDVTWVPPTYYGEVVVFYKKDDGDWTYLTTTYNIVRGKSEITFTDPDLSTINALSNINELQLKFFLISTSGTRPAIVYAHTLKGFARTPIKSVYSFPIDVSAVTERLESGNPDTMMSQFWTWAMSAEALLMTSQHPRLHNKTVIIVPRSIRTAYIDRSNETFAADFYLEVREV